MRIYLLSSPSLVLFSIILLSLFSNSNKVIAQESSSCFLRDSSGQLRDLSSICGQSIIPQTSSRLSEENLSDEERAKSEQAEDGLVLQNLQNRRKAEIIPQQCSAAAVEFDSFSGWDYLNKTERNNPCLNQQYQYNEQYIQRLSYRTSTQIYQGYYNKLDNLCRQSSASTCDQIDGGIRNRLESESFERVEGKQQNARGFRFLR